MNSREKAAICLLLLVSSLEDEKGKEKIEKIEKYGQRVQQHISRVKIKGR